MEFEAIIGLEIHVQMKTNSKMFSRAPVSFGSEPNTNVDILDIAFPGTMPVPNKQAIINAIRVCSALKMNIDNIIMFDRKNYFYSDLPKGYQITQHFRPIGKDGFLLIEVNEKEKKIGIKSLHIEEDTCKQIHIGESTLLDFNRAGIPLLEIVSFPDMRSGEEASKYVDKLRSIVCFLGVSDGKMEEGSLRCDVNISLKEKGNDFFGSKVEIKNLNSLNNIQKAVDYEISRQSLILEKGEKVFQETRRFDEASKTTIPMRKKVDEVDYNYFVDSNISPILLTDDFIKTIIESSPDLAEKRFARYKSLGLSDYDSSQLVSNKDISDYFEEAFKSGANPKLIANWIISDVQSYLKKMNISITEFNVSPHCLGKLILLIEKEMISNKQARYIFDRMIKTGEDPELLAVELGLVQINSEEDILNIVKEVLDDNPNQVEKYKNGKDRVLDFFVGLVMKKTNGKANPSLTSKLLIQELKRR